MDKVALMKAKVHLLGMAQRSLPHLGAPPGCRGDLPAEVFVSPRYDLPDDCAGVIGKLLPGHFFLRLTQQVVCSLGEAHDFRLTSVYDAAGACQIDVAEAFKSAVAARAMRDKIKAGIWEPEAALP